MNTYNSYQLNRGIGQRRKNRAGLHNRRFARFAALLIVTIMGFIFGVIIHANAYSSDIQTISNTQTISDLQTPEVKAAAQIIHVEKGDSLWSIARTHVSKDMDVREYIVQIKKLNALSNSSLREGQRLRLP